MQCKFQLTNQSFENVVTQINQIKVNRLNLQGLIRRIHLITFLKALIN